MNVTVRNPRRRWPRLAVTCVSAVLVAGLLGGCTQATSRIPDAEEVAVSPGERRPTPALDAAAPEGLETAVFGLG